MTACLFSVAPPVASTLLALLAERKKRSSTMSYRSYVYFGNETAKGSTSADVRCRLVLAALEDEIGSRSDALLQWLRGSLFASSREDAHLLKLGSVELTIQSIRASFTTQRERDALRAASLPKSS